MCGLLEISALFIIDFIISLQYKVYLLTLDAIHSPITVWSWCKLSKAYISGRRSTNIPQAEVRASYHELLKGFTKSVLLLIILNLQLINFLKWINWLKFTINLRIWNYIDYIWILITRWQCLLKLTPHCFNPECTRSLTFTSLQLSLRWLINF